MLAASVLFCETCESEYRQQMDMQVAGGEPRKYPALLAAVLVKLRTFGSSAASYMVLYVNKTNTRVLISPQSDQEFCSIIQKNHLYDKETN